MNLYFVINLLCPSDVSLMYVITFISLFFSGCDEVDYSSECLAHTAGVSVSRTGKCDGTEEFT
jgi:hypothetical protein